MITKDGKQISKKQSFKLIKEEWNDTFYQKFLTYLQSHQDDKYRLFHHKLLKEPNVINIGVRTPILKNIAKEISKGNYLSFIECIQHKFYEEDVIYGLILGYIKIPFNDLTELIIKFLPNVNNWATNDLVCANLKVFHKEQEKGFVFIQSLLSSSEPWYIRFGLVLLLDFYINDNYIDKTLDVCSKLKHRNYYVLMALSWLISICYINYPQKTIKLFTEDYLDDFTHNKSIQKITESTRVDIKIKNKLKSMKRNKNEKEVHKKR